ncbi:MAG: LPS assembly lipoprotein LptE [Thiobacillus sp.]
MNRRLFLTAIPVALAAGCGFQLRRLDGMPFASLYIDAPSGSEVAQHIRKALAAHKGLRLTASVAEAEAVLTLSQENRKKTILSLSGAGRVTEYRLSLQLTYSISGQGDRSIAVPETIELNRDMTYDDSQLLAKSAEEQLLYRAMDENAALRIMRRLQNLAPSERRG